MAEKNTSGPGDERVEYTGASLAWTSDDPAIAQAREWIGAGRFAEAESLLQWSAASAAGARAREEMHQVIRCIRWDYELDEAGLLAKLRPLMPDVAAGDLQQWREAGELQYRIIDGQLRYFRREPANLWRFCDEAKQRRDRHAAQQTPTTPPAAPAFVLEAHLAKVIAAAERTGRTYVCPIRHRVRFTATVLPGPMLKAGAMIRCWLPFAHEHPRQSDLRLVSTEPAGAIISPDGVGHRTAYVEQRVGDPAKEINFRIEFTYMSRAYYPNLSDAAARPLSPSYSGGYLAERPPHIRFTPAMKDLVEGVVDGETNPLARARRIYEYVATHIRYCAEEEYCTIPSFSDKALRSRKGDCGIQSMMFITMCRCAGIPARWQSGWESRPTMWNMHDWAEFYVEPWGWLPADPSYGLRKSDDRRVQNFYFGHQDSYRMIVNVDYGWPLHPPKGSLRSEPADFQRGEIEIDGRNLYYDHWDYDMQFEWEAVGE